MRAKPSRKGSEEKGQAQKEVPVVLLLVLVTTTPHEPLQMQDDDGPTSVPGSEVSAALLAPGTLSSQSRTSGSFLTDNGDCRGETDGENRSWSSLIEPAISSPGCRKFKTCMLGADSFLNNQF